MTVEAKLAAAAIVDDPTYRKNLASRALSGKLHPSIEAMLWYYAKGKPKESIEHSGNIGVETPEAIAERVRTLEDDELKRLNELHAERKRILEIAAARTRPALG